MIDRNNGRQGKGMGRSSRIISTTAPSAMDHKDEEVTEDSPKTGFLNTEKKEKNNNNNKKKGKKGVEVKKRGNSGVAIETASDDDGNNNEVSPPLRRPAKYRMQSKPMDEGSAVVTLPAVPRKARTAMMKRPAESSPPPRLATDALRQQPQSASSMAHLGSSDVSSSNSQSEKPRAKKRPSKSPKALTSRSTISEQEVQVAETLFDLARMVTNQAKPPSPNTEFEAASPLPSPIASPSPSSNNTPEIAQSTEGAPEWDHPPIQSKTEDESSLPPQSAMTHSNSIKGQTEIEEEIEQNKVPMIEAEKANSDIRNIHSPPCREEAVPASSLNGRCSPPLAEIKPLKAREDGTPNSELLPLKSSLNKPHFEMCTASENHQVLAMPSVSEAKLNTMKRQPQSGLPSEKPHSLKFEIDLMAPPIISMASSENDQAKDDANANNFKSNAEGGGGLVCAEVRDASGNEMVKEESSICYKKPKMADAMDIQSLGIKEEKEFSSIKEKTCGKESENGKTESAKQSSQMLAKSAKTEPKSPSDKNCMKSASGNSYAPTIWPPLGGIKGDLSAEDLHEPSLQVPQFILPSAKRYKKSCTRHIHIAYFIKMQQKQKPIQKPLFYPTIDDAKAERGISNTNIPLPFSDAIMSTSSHGTTGKSPFVGRNGNLAKQGGSTEKVGNSNNQGKSTTTPVSGSEAYFGNRIRSRSSLDPVKNVDSHEGLTQKDNNGDGVQYLQTITQQQSSFPFSISPAHFTPPHFLQQQQGGQFSSNPFYPSQSVHALDIGSLQKFSRPSSPSHSLQQQQHSLSRKIVHGLNERETSSTADSSFPITTTTTTATTANRNSSKRTNQSTEQIHHHISTLPPSTTGKTHTVNSKSRLEMVDFNKGEASRSLSQLHKSSWQGQHQSQHQNQHIFPSSQIELYRSSCDDSSYMSGNHTRNASAKGAMTTASDLSSASRMMTSSSISLNFLSSSQQAPLLSNQSSKSVSDWLKTMSSSSSSMTTDLSLTSFGMAKASPNSCGQNHNDQQRAQNGLLVSGVPPSGILSTSIGSKQTQSRRLQSTTIQNNSSSSTSSVSLPVSISPLSPPISKLNSGKGTVGSSHQRFSGSKNENLTVTPTTSVLVPNRGVQQQGFNAQQQQQQQQQLYFLQQGHRDSHLLPLHSIPKQAQLDSHPMFFQTQHSESLSASFGVSPSSNLRPNSQDGRRIKGSEGVRSSGGTTNANALHRTNAGGPPFLHPQAKDHS